MAVTGSKTRLLLLLACCGVLAACASGNQKKSAPIGFFVAEPRPGDIRMFTYAVVIRQKAARPIRQSVSARHQEEPDLLHKNRDAILKKTDRSLQKHPDYLSYCPKGHVAIERYIALNEAVIRGECNY